MLTGLEVSMQQRTRSLKSSSICFLFVCLFVCFYVEYFCLDYLMYIGYIILSYLVKYTLFSAVDQNDLKYRKIQRRPARRAEGGILHVGGHKCILARSHTPRDYQ